MSIGTGSSPHGALGESILGLVKTLVDMSTETEKTANDFERGYPGLGNAGRYFRFNVKGLEQVGLEEHAKMNEIVAATRDYLRHQETYSKLKRCANMLKGTPIESPIPQVVLEQPEASIETRSSKPISQRASAGKSNVQHQPSTSESSITPFRDFSPEGLIAARQPSTTSEFSMTDDQVSMPRDSAIEYQQ